MNLDILNELDVLGKIIKGEIPRPSMLKTIPMNPVKAKKGFAEFQGKACKDHLNPVGTVHGGFAATIFDSATGCAVHSRSFIVPSGWVFPKARQKMRPPA